MAKFFEKIKDIDAYEEWADVLDWLSDDKKFQNETWNRGFKSSLTNKIKRLPWYPKDEKNIVHKKGKLEYPNQVKGSRSKRSVYIFMEKGNGFGEDIIRHIRNSIFHGTATTHNFNSVNYIEIKDYSNDCRDDNSQTAYITIPMNAVIDIHNKYVETCKDSNNTKPKDRRQTAKYKKEK